MKLLFVCHGNICRSPMAEYVMRSFVCDAGLETRISVASAATSSEEIGNPIYPPAFRQLAKHGIDASKHRARQLTRNDYADFDFLIGMDSANLRNMRRFFGGDPNEKLSLLLDFTGHPADVPDPWYSGDFERTWREVDAGCRALLKQLQENCR